MASFTLSKHERLKSRKLIDELFTSGKSLFSHPIKLIYLEQEGLDVPLKMAVSVPKRNFKSAVDRNLMKRRIREAYRLNKGHLQSKLTEENRSIALMLIFVGKKEDNFLTIQAAIEKLLSRL